jgi:hypothetical protein
VRDEERQVDQEQQPNKQIAGDRLLKRLGINPNKWTVGDRRIALLGLGIGLTIVNIAVCGYVFGWDWTGLTKPQRTFWDWLSLLIVPIVLALGGYLFNRSESRRTKEDAERQRAVDREIADERRQDGMLQLLTDKDRPLHRAQVGDSLSTIARARTLTVLARLEDERKGSVLRFLHESGLLIQDRLVLDLAGADLRGADLNEASLRGANLSLVNLSGANLSGADLGWADLIQTNLSGSNLIGTYLAGAVLAGANLT